MKFDETNKRIKSDLRYAVSKINATAAAEQWCRKRFGQKAASFEYHGFGWRSSAVWSFWHEDDDLIFYFKHDIDAIEFKLMWG